jgi:hypothetical protein
LNPDKKSCGTCKYKNKEHAKMQVISRDVNCPIIGKTSMGDTYRDFCSEWQST